MNKRIRFNTELLEKLAGKSAPDGAKTRVLAAMNADRRKRFDTIGHMDQGEIRYKTLDRWLTAGNRLPTFLDAIISYCNNNTDGITIGDFFVYEDDNATADMTIAAPQPAAIEALNKKMDEILERLKK